MSNQYQIYNEFVFINRRLIKTRFNRNLVLFCGVNNEGKTIVFGVSLIKDDNQDSYKFAIDNFLNSISNALQPPPKAFIIERVSQLKNAIEMALGQRKNTNISLLYCFQHLHKSLKFQIKQLLALKEHELSEKVKALMDRVERLPMLDGCATLKRELEECKVLS